MIYKWRTYNQKVPAQIVGEHIEQLSAEYETITPQLLVDNARPEGAVMHPLYEWDDSIAAEKYRVQQSTHIMSELVIVHVEETDVDEDDKKPVMVRAFHSVSNHRETANYQPIAKIIENEEMESQVLQNARKDLESFQRKYQGLIDIKALFLEFIR